MIGVGRLTCCELVGGLLSGEGGAGGRASEVGGNCDVDVVVVMTVVGGSRVESRE